MTQERQDQIAEAFPESFSEFSINLYLSLQEFEIFNRGVFSVSMDEKWNIFVKDDVMYWARSWSGNCIYKVTVMRQANNILLSNVLVNRDKNQYSSIDIEFDKSVLINMIQFYLKYAT